MSEAILPPDGSPVPLTAPAYDPKAKLSLGAACWALFEGGRTPFVILITIYIFMPYLARTVVGDPVKGQVLVSQMQQFTGWTVALTAPLLGASIDKLGGRKFWLALITVLMVPLIASLWFTRADGAGLSVGVTLLIAYFIGVLFTYSEVFHNSLLIRAAGFSTAHKASGLALSLGNGFSVLALGFTAWAFALPGLPSTASWAWLPHAPLFGLSRALHEPERVVALMSAAVFALCAVPFFFFTPDAPKTGIPVVTAFKGGAADLWGMIKTVREFRDAATFLVSRMFYVDGMTAILIFGGIYASGVMKWGALELLAFGVILSILGVVGGFVGHWMDHRLGPKRSVQIAQNAQDDAKG